MWLQLYQRIGNILYLIKGIYCPSNQMVLNIVTSDSHSPSASNCVIIEFHQGYVMSCWREFLYGIEKCRFL